MSLRGADTVPLDVEVPSWSTYVDVLSSFPAIISDLNGAELRG